MSTKRWTLRDAPFEGRTGAGVRVAVVDSGVNAGHPHVGDVLESVRISAGTGEIDATDRLGHGTAVAAAIKEKAPAIELLSVRVFDRALATSAEVLAQGITWAAKRGARLINLSLGTAVAEHAEVLRAAVEQAVSRGAIVVSARESDGTTWLPGSLAGVAGVLVSWECDRDEVEVHLDAAGVPTFLASRYPRPIPGVPRDRNLAGASFAVANVTGFLARALERDASVRAVGDLPALLRDAR